MDSSTADAANTIGAEEASRGMLRRRGKDLMLTGMVCTALLLLFWMCVLLSGTNVVGDLQTMSAKFRILDPNSAPVLFFLMFLSFLALWVWVYLVTCRKTLFLCLLFCSFVLSETVIAQLNVLAFGVRYISIAVLVSVGLVAFIRRARQGIDFLQILGLMYLAWSVVNLFINGFYSESLAMLPMQIMIVFGVFFGFQQLHESASDVSRTCRVIARLGLGFTFFHLLSLAVVPQAFLAGRLRASYILPTNFANSYVLLFIAMIWLWIADRMTLKSLAEACVIVLGFGLLFLSGTRNSMLMIATVVPIFLIVWKKKVPILLTVSVVVFVVVAYVALQESRTLATVGERLANFSPQGRMGMWELTWKYVVQRPFVGYGLGRELEILAGSLEKWELLNPHNAYLGVWIQTGAVGLLLVALMYLTAISRGLKVLFGKAVPMSVRGTMALPLALLVALFVCGMFEELFASRTSIQELMWAVSMSMVATVKRSRDQATCLHARETVLASPTGHLSESGQR